MLSNKKQTTLTIILLFSSSLSMALEKPSNRLQAEYKKQQQVSPEIDILSLDAVYHIPKATYQYLDDVFTSFYKKVTFQTTITDSTFIQNSHYEVVSIPLINDVGQGLQVELFGNFSDSSKNHLSNVSSDQALYNYYSKTQGLDIYNSELAIGAGFSFSTSENSKIKVIISNRDMPGYGNSNALLGFETNF